MAYILVALTGTGTDTDPYRPNFPITVPPLTSLPGFRWSAHIPSNPDGTPRFADCYVWIPDSFTLPEGVSIAPIDSARATIVARDAKAKPQDMERLP
jgi:hypothetical protein